MSKETWTEIIVGTVIIGALGFLSSKIMDMNGTLGGVDARVTSTSDRVERIASVLSEVGVRVAHEELNRPIKTMVVTTLPKKTDPEGHYVTIVNVIDAETSDVWTFPVAMESASGKRDIATIAWAGAVRSNEYASFKTMQAYAKEASVDASLPSYVDPTTSFTLTSTSAKEYLKEISSVAPSPQKLSATIEVGNWKDVSKALKDNKEELSSIK
jgi:hypothetical protein